MKTQEIDLTPHHLLPNLYHIKHTDPGAQKMGVATNTYVLTADKKALLIDAPFDYLMNPIKEILSKGFTLSGAVFTHRHLFNSGSFLNAFTAEFDVPLLLHPADQNSQQVRNLPYSFENPVGHPLLEEFGLEAIHFPGHTEGSILLYQELNEGLIFSGDTAIGSTYKELENRTHQLVRVPPMLSVDDGQTRENWKQFDRPFAHFGPFHGATIIDSAKDRNRFLTALRRGEPTESLM